MNTIEFLIADIRQGKMVILMDDENRENEGDLVMAASKVTAQDINFMARFGRGLICLTLTPERCRQLRLLPMVNDNQSQFSTRFTVSIDAAEGVTTGISAADRALTIQKAVASKAKPEDLVQPGHVFPLMAQPGGVLYRAGHTEAGCDLARLAGLDPSAVIVEVLNEDGSMARRPDLEEFAKLHDLKIGTIADLIQYRLANEKTIERVTEKKISTAYGIFDLVAYFDTLYGQFHVALVKGKMDADVPTLVRVQVEDWLSDILGEEKKLSKALQAISEVGHGVVVILGKEKPLASFIEQLTENAPPKADDRTIGVGCQILRDLGVQKMRVMSASKRSYALSGFQLEVIEYLPL